MSLPFLVEGLQGTDLANKVMGHAEDHMYYCCYSYQAIPITGDVGCRIEGGVYPATKRTQTDIFWQLILAVFDSTCDEAMLEIKV
jgi:hypothetical protein